VAASLHKIKAALATQVAGSAQTAQTAVPPAPEADKET